MFDGETATTPGSGIRAVIVTVSICRREGAIVVERCRM